MIPGEHNVRRAMFGETPEETMPGLFWAIMRGIARAAIVVFVLILWAMA